MVIVTSKTNENCNSLSKTIEFFTQVFEPRFGMALLYGIKSTSVMTNNMLYRCLIDKTCLIDEISDLQCILTYSVEGWLMICRDQSLTIGGLKNVCQHWIFY